MFIMTVYLNNYYLNFFPDGLNQFTMSPVTYVSVYFPTPLQTWEIYQCFHLCSNSSERLPHYYVISIEITSEVYIIAHLYSTHPQIIFISLYEFFPGHSHLTLFCTGWLDNSYIILYSLVNHRYFIKFFK